MYSISLPPPVVFKSLTPPLRSVLLQEMIEEADRDQDGVVNADEFYRVMRKREDPLDDLDSDDEY